MEGCRSVPGVAAGMEFGIELEARRKTLYRQASERFRTVMLWRLLAETLELQAILHSF